MSDTNHEPEPNHQFRGVWIPRTIWESEALTWMEKCLLAEIDALDDGGGCFASNDYLATKMGTTTSTAANAISKLRSLGFIQDIGFDGRKRRMRATHSPEALAARAAIAKAAIEAAGLKIATGTSPEPSPQDESSIHTGVKAAFTPASTQPSLIGEGSIHAGVNIGNSGDQSGDQSGESQSTGQCPAASGGRKKAEPSDEGLRFADWFKTLIPATQRLETSWRKNWAICYDDMRRIDGRTKEDIAAVCRWARTDDFWKGNFRTPVKLRQKDKGQSQYFDVFLQRIETLGINKKPGTALKPTPKPATPHNPEFESTPATQASKFSIRKPQNTTTTTTKND